MASKNKIIVNVGNRTYHLVNAEDGTSRTLAPGGSIETLNEKEAKHYLRYHDIKDFAESSPATAARIKHHEAEIERLKAENDALKKQHAVHVGDSIEELNAESAGTGFAGPGGPGAMADATPNPDTAPTLQPTPDSKEAKEHADRDSRQTTHRKR